MSLQLDYISTLHTEADITSRLGRLPRKLSDSYEELWATKTRSYEPEDMSRLDLALSLLLTNKTPTPAVFARFVFGDGDGNDNNQEEDIETEGTISQNLARIGLNRPQDCMANQNDPLLGMITGLCFGLVILDTTTNSFRFAHVSVQEYIVSCRDGYKSLSQTHTRIAKRCLSVLVEPESVVDSVQPFTNRPLWPNEESDKRSSGIFPDGNYIKNPDSDNTIGWISISWAYYVAGSNEFRQTPTLKHLEARLQDSIDGISWESLNPIVFLSACQYGNLQLVRKWLNHYPRLARLILRPSNKGFLTPLHFAAVSNCPDIVVCLLHAGAEVGACSLHAGYKAGVTTIQRTGVTPLHLAVSKSSLQMVLTLLQNRSQVDAKDCPGPCLDIEEDMAIALRLAVLQRHEKIVQALLYYGASSNTWKGVNPLHTAVQCSALQIVRLLLGHGANVGVNDPADISGNTSLIAAVLDGNDEIIELLLAAGADSNITNLYGHNALIVAAETGNLKAVNALVPLTTNLNSQEVDSNTALSHAATNGHQAIVEALLDAGAEVEPQEPGPHCSFLDPSERRSGYSLSALASALISENESIFRLILRVLARRESHGGYAEALHSLDLVGWDSFSTEGLLRDMQDAIEKFSLFEGGMYRTETLSMLVSMLPPGKNPFEQFARAKIVKLFLRQVENQDFVEKNQKRINAIIKERIEKLAQE